ncbi:hypothetical protein [Dolichospermum circinale]|nr:hypothetical protein [Dolichospermum circinale]MDB9460512.1 hypothetical protein [Dolichospermum circinale CS-545/17]MDB9467390.1 hypothetical protein [Dolichospermum circinale CS-539/09]MDB9471552.1 hypothetical protein [Dolichospermum circinale CS-539]
MSKTKTQEPISNLEYDFISVLHNKAVAVQAYENYIKDAKEEFS